MHDNDAEPTTRLQDFARSHTIRANILTLFTQDKGRSLDPADLLQDLPNKATAVVISYHLKVLRSASLLPPQAASVS
ncbi:MAG: hypothetical protein ACJ75S_06265 [Solirubrobacterales bacterium]